MSNHKTPLTKLEQKLSTTVKASIHAGLDEKNGKNPRIHHHREQPDHSARHGEPVGEVILYTGDGVPCAPFKQVKWASGVMPDEGTKLYTATPSQPKEPEREPYAIEAGFDNGDGTYSVRIERLPLRTAPHKDWSKHEKLLYTAPQQRMPLTIDQKYALIEKHLGLKQRRNDTVIDQYTGLFYSAKPYLDLIDEAAHSIKGDA